VRRSQRPLLCAVLIGSGLPAAVAVAAVANVALAPILGGPFPLMSTFELGATVLIAATVAELGWAFTDRPRPWAVNRQVPQSWGHQHGPWKAALRYGPRLAVGPATILTSWAWWAGLFIAVGAGGWESLWFSVVFVVTRSVNTVALAGNPSDGIKMAARMAQVRAADTGARYLSVCVLIFSWLLWAGPLG
jgi:hypothetical protein